MPASEPSTTLAIGASAFPAPSPSLHRCNEATPGVGQKLPVVQPLRCELFPAAAAAPAAPAHACLLGSRVPAVDGFAIASLSPWVLSEPRCFLFAAGAGVGRGIVRCENCWGTGTVSTRVSRPRRLHVHAGIQVAPQRMSSSSPPQCFCRSVAQYGRYCAIRECILTHSNRDKSTRCHSQQCTLLRVILSPCLDSCLPLGSVQPLFPSPA